MECRATNSMDAHFSTCSKSKFRQKSDFARASTDLGSCRKCDGYYLHRHPCKSGASVDDTNRFTGLPNDGVLIPDINEVARLIKGQTIGFGTD